MGIELSKEETRLAVASLRRYLGEEFEIEAGEMRAQFLLAYILREIAPLAYNQGMKDAGDFLRAKLEDLPATCFEHGLTFWESKKKK